MTDLKFKDTEDQASILVVDDNLRNLQVMSALLKQKGYKLYITNSGENALQFLDHTIPDLVLLDVMMPGMSGYEVCRKIRSQEHLEDLPVIFLTAKNELEDVVEGFEAGAVDYITKPFQTKEVYVRINNHIQLKKVRQQLKDQNLYLEALNSSLKESKETIEEDARQLALLNAEKNRFFSIIAHDLRGPLSGLMGLSEILHSQIQQLSMPEIREMVEALHESSAQMFSLLENLLGWARIQMNSLTFEPEIVRLDIIFEETLAVYHQQADAKRITIHGNCRSDLEVFADPNMLKTILRNLVSNAIKFTNRGGRIGLDCHTSGNGQVAIQVSDTGIGMDQSLAGKIFAIDQKVLRQGTEGEKSSGLGLLLALDLAKKNNGSLEVESQPGKGSTFTLFLPAEGPRKQES